MSGEYKTGTPEDQTHIDILKGALLDTEIYKNIPAAGGAAAAATAAAAADLTSKKRLIEEAFKHLKNHDGQNLTDDEYGVLFLLLKSMTIADKLVNDGGAHSTDIRNDLTGFISHD
jgi:hypothetical protein